MTVLSSFARPHPGSAVAIGAFDGVHRGHREVVAMLRERAGAAGLASVVLTFDRHPASVVRPESAPKLLCDLAQKLELLDATGVDHVVVLPFDQDRAAEPAEEFVTDVLVARLGARLVAVGEDFHFGRGRGGNVALLADMGAGLGFEVAALGLVGAGPGDVAGPGSAAGPVSSTAIRRLLADGLVELAAGLLGRPHEVRGTVCRGDGRGRELGYPTANVAVPEDILLPAPGIYAGWCAERPAAISLGVRPTFGDGDARPLVLEAYLLDFDGDLYGQAVAVSFVSRLRDELRFASVQDLVGQMARDVQAARTVLAG